MSEPGVAVAAPRSNQPDERRGLRLALAAVFTIIMVVVGIAICGVIVFSVLQTHASARQKALARDPSYRFGERAWDRYEPDELVPGGISSACITMLGQHPGRFKGFNAALALRGCHDEWEAIER